MKSQAERNYLRRIATTVAAYLILTYISTWTVHHLHPSRPIVYLLALIPTLAVVKMLHVVALYIQEQKDEYLRAQLVRAILVGITATLVASSFSDFLFSYDHGRGLPPFTLFTICWVVTGIAQSVQSHRNRAPEEEGAR
jgi:FtsH-binding integral membrane protein